jgi:hypothetical protein
MEVASSGGNNPNKVMRNTTSIMYTHLVGAVKANINLHGVSNYHLTSNRLGHLN